MAVAFSSGVDSTFLLYAAKEALGDREIAVGAVTPEEIAISIMAEVIAAKAKSFGKQSN